MALPLIALSDVILLNITAYADDASRRLLFRRYFRHMMPYVFSISPRHYVDYFTLR